MSVPLLGTILLGIAILHTFSVKWFARLASKFKEGSIAENALHLLSEVEVVFGFWAIIFCIGIALIQSGQDAIQYIEHLSFVEPAFVLVIMVMAATRPVVYAANGLIVFLARLIPINKDISFLAVALFIGPLLGSFITEPAAMTVTALLLKRRFFDRKISERLKYLILGTLFVNISIGGVLTPYAAPPVLMVAQKWGWDLNFMLTHFGWRACIAVLLNSLIASVLFRLSAGPLIPHENHARVEHVENRKPAIWLVAIHLLLIGLVVKFVHQPILFTAVFMLFLGVVRVTKEYQQALKIQEGMLVAFFLAGLVVLGGVQGWWLEPLLSSLTESKLFLGATALTAVTDNAALTYLGSQVEGISDSFKYALVAGAVTGGGLTVIANAPNPAGYGMLREDFEHGVISPVHLFLGAALPTLVSVVAFWFL